MDQEQTSAEIETSDWPGADEDALSDEVAGGASGGDGEVAALREALATTDDARRAALTRLKAALIASEPDIAAELVMGETVEEVEASFAAAVDLLQRIRQRVGQAATAVPAGAPGRMVTEPASAFDKIRRGLGGRREA